MMKKAIIVGAIALLPLTVQAESYDIMSGMQFGAQFGYSYQHYDKSWLLKKAGFTSVGSVDNRGYAGRLMIGYAWNNYFALQGGWLFMNEVRYKNINGTSDRNLEQEVGDLTGKISLPIEYVGLYIKPGLGYLHLKEFRVGTSKVHSDSEIVPLVGGGIDFYLTQNVTINTEFDHYFTVNDFKAIDYYGVGATYQFA